MQNLNLGISFPHNATTDVRNQQPAAAEQQVVQEVKVEENYDEGDLQVDFMGVLQQYVLKLYLKNLCTLFKKLTYFCQEEGVDLQNAWSLHKSF